MNYPWAVLKIESTSDLKSIKKAYARLLRNSKPDENRDEFILLNEAYQEALRIAKHSNHSEQIATPNSYSFPEQQVAETLTSDAPVMDSSHKEYSPNQHIDRELIENDQWPPNTDYFYHNIGTPQDNEKVNSTVMEVFKLIEENNYNIKSWKKILNKPNIVLDGRLVEQLSYYIFQAMLEEVKKDKILQTQVKPIREQSTFNLLVTSPYYAGQKNFLDKNIEILLYFDTLFGWSTDWKTLAQQLGNEAFHIVDVIEKAKKNRRSTVEKWVEKQIAGELKQPSPFSRATLELLTSAFGLVARRFNITENSKNYGMYLKIFLLVCSVILASISVLLLLALDIFIKALP